jgi:outer membrane protein assembly factor BamB
MKATCCAVLLAASASVFAADWLTDGGNPSRDNWQKREKGLTPDNVKGLKLLWKRELPESTLTAPVILGPIITHRGIKELVFVEGGSSTIYALDADLGRTFWTRKLPVGAACAGMPVTPVITPERVRTEEDGEGHTPLRPIYFAAGDGMLHRVLPTTGEDNGPVSGGCGKPVDIPPFVAADTLSFSWKGRSVTIPGDLKLAGITAGLATWEDARGVRWIYGTTSTGIQAWTYSGTTVNPQWSVHGLSSPVIANGMMFALGDGELHVVDAIAGRELFSTSAETSGASPLALANGHICFSAGKTVFCFGLPIEI